MKHVTRHQLDTCSCVRLFEWDDEDEQHTETPLEEYTNPNGDVFTAVRCPAHQHLDTVEHSDVIVEENQRVQKTLLAIRERFPELLKDDAIDESVVKLAFDERRDLVLDVPTLTKSRRNELDKATDSRVVMAGGQ